MEWADSHTHLHFSKFDLDRDAVLRRARAAGVRYMNVIGVRLEEAPALIDLCETDPDLRATVGVHPHNAAQADGLTLDHVVKAADHPSVAAIGEAGLDFHRDRSPRKRQEEVFRVQICAAREAGLPLVIHTRSAEAETMRIVDEEGGVSHGGVIHCFSGSAELARWALAHGLHISFSGTLTDGNARALRQLAGGIPEDRLLVETDAPYLTPVGCAGRRNEPACVGRVAEVLARVRGATVEEIARVTTENYIRLFRRGREGSGGRASIEG